MAKDITKKPRPKIAHTYGAKDIGRWKFEEHAFPGPWKDHLGIIPKRFMMYVDGEAGHGKTEYQIQLAHMLAGAFGKVRLNNVEQGKHVQIKESVERNQFNLLKPGKFAYCSIKDFDVYVEQLRRPNSGRVQIIDSISYFPLTVDQVQFLIENFPNKSFVFVGYQVHFNQYKAVRHLCDIKVRVKDFMAHIEANRFGGTADFVIWDKPKKLNGQLSLI